MSTCIYMRLLVVWSGTKDGMSKRQAAGQWGVWSSCLQFPGQTHRANPNWKRTQPLQTHCWNMTDTSETRKFLLEMTCFLAKAEMVKQYSTAAVAFRVHSGASCFWGEWKHRDMLASWHCHPRDKICMASPSKLRAIAGRTPWACQVKGIFFLKAHHCFSFFKW